MRLGCLAVMGALGCRPSALPVLPADAATLSIEQVRPWVQATQLRGNSIRQFKWLFQDDRSSAGGDGAARIAAPDSLRFDARGPLGWGRMAAFVVGDQPVWAEPEATVAQIVPDYVLFWAMFGVTRMPHPRARIRGLDDGRTQLWEYSLGGDTVVYSRSKALPGKVTAEVRRNGRLFGRVETRLSADGMAATSKLIVPDVPAQLDLTFKSTSTEASFPPAIWLPPEQ